MKKIYVLSALTLLTVGLLTQPVKPVNEVTQDLSFKEAALDYNNETGFKLENKNASVGVGEYDVSSTYVQFGMINEDGKDLYVMRFATAVKGDLTSLTYTRDAIEGSEAKQVEVTTLYKSIKSGEETYYYNGTDLTTDEADAGNYYWACYTVKYNNGEHFATDLLVRLTVNGVEEASLTTSFDVEYGRVEDGSEAYPYLISTSEEWQSVIDEVNAYTLSEGEEDIYIGEGKYYKLVNNITQTEVLGKDYIYFASVIDGNGYTINANISVDGERAALVNRTSQLFEAKNLNVAGNISATNAVEFNGSVVAANYGNVTNCKSSVKLSVNSTSTTSDIGGIVGFHSVHGAITNCEFDGVIDSNLQRIGGIVGRSKGDINNCVNNSSIEGTRTVGGIVGHVDGSGTISNCKNLQAISGTTLYVGGIVGYLNAGSVIECENRGLISAETAYHVGGIAGTAVTGGTITKSNNYGTVDAAGSQTSGSWGGVAGIAGTVLTNCTIEYCGNYGNVTGTFNVGGIVGYSQGSKQSTASYITNCINNEGAVITVNDNSGGCIVGRNNFAYMSGNINYGYYIGDTNVGYIYGRNNLDTYDDGTNVNYYVSEN